MASLKLLCGLALASAISGTASRLALVDRGVPAAGVVEWMGERGFQLGRRMRFAHGAPFDGYEMVGADNGCPVLVIELARPEALRSLIASRIGDDLWAGRRYWLGGLLAEGDRSSAELHLWRIWYRLSMGSPPPRVAVLFSDTPACVG